MTYLLDAFGTRLDPTELVAGLDSVGLVAARLWITDEAVVLCTDPPDLRHDAVAGGLTWLRSRFSPLVPLRIDRRDAAPGADRFVDGRLRPLLPVALAEVSDPARLDGALDHLLERLGAPSHDLGRSRADPVAPAAQDGGVARVATSVAAALGDRLRARGLASGGATVSVLDPVQGTLRPLGAMVQPGADAAPGPHLLVWIRVGGARGVRPAAIVAASWSLAGLRRLEQAMQEFGPPPPEAPAPELFLDGLVWRAARRPAIAAPPDPAAPAPESPIRVDPERCTACGTCAAVCPTGYLGARGLPVLPDPDACVRCYECVDACPDDALRPVYAADAGTRERSLAHRPGWLSRLTGQPGPSFPSIFPPSYLLPNHPPVAPSASSAPSAPRKPRYVLGLAVMTMQEHAAVLLRDGEVVGAIEQERLVRIRHAGWSPPGRPGVTVAVDPTLAIEEALCRRPIRALLEQEGITLDDVEAFAFNGLHGRFVRTISFVDGRVPLPTMRVGRAIYLPHHLCHAASAFRPSGARSAWIFTVDGRGDRECAAIFRAEDGRIEMVDTLLALADRSIGGVYEGVTRHLGFGGHGQGSVMALASFGQPRFDLRPFLSVEDSGAPSIHETGIAEAFAELRAVPGAARSQPQKDLAASLQAALEDTALALVGRALVGTAGEPVDALCLGGGVALNCRMNERLRRAFSPQTIFVQPAANDAGTALGAALEAWSLVSGERTHAAMAHSYLGPAFSNEAIEQVLRRSGLRYRRVESIAHATAAALVEGKVVCWFQGHMEFGPRALGGRSIVADPTNPAMKDRVNGIKQREPWRPFGPSILAGHEGAWLDRAFDARFMVFTLPVLEHQRARVPAVVHVDGTTRPQVVHPETAPVYHAMIEEFHRLTGVPMVLNTSFNRRGEPIVCTPSDAVESFVGLGADLLAIGDFLVEPVRAEVPALPAPGELARLPGGRRLALRLTTRCDYACGHCTLRDQHGRQDRTFSEALRALAEGRQAGCDELVFMRGEPTLRADLADLVEAARAMGYRFVQVQTNGHALAQPAWRTRLLRAGVSAFEVMVLADDERLHNELSDRPGSFVPSMTALKALAASDRELLVTVPVLRRNLRRLRPIVALLHRLGVRRVQFNFPRPVETKDQVITDPVPRLSIAARYVAPAARAAAQLGMQVTTEAFPDCLLPPDLRGSPDAVEDFGRHRIDDLHLVHESLGAVRGTQRPEAPACRDCAHRQGCPRTWGLYLELVGTDELTAIPGSPPA